MARRRAHTSPAPKPRDPAEVAAELDALYAQLPKLDCKGDCWKCCGKVLMAPGERERVQREYGVALPTVPEARREKRELCPALVDHRCTVYTARPMMCRLWGVDEGLKCPYGCVPEGGWMTEREVAGFFLRAYAIAGWPVEKEEQLNPRQVRERLRVFERNWAALPEAERARVQPGPGEGRRRRRLPWRRSE